MQDLSYDVEVGEHDSLGQTSGATAVWNNGDIFLRVELHRRKAVAIVVHQLVEIQAPAGSTQQDHLLHAHNAWAACICRAEGPFAYLDGGTFLGHLLHNISVRVCAVDELGTRVLDVMLHFIYVHTQISKLIVEAKLNWAYMQCRKG